MTIILGVDPGETSGWARIRLLSTGPLELLDHGQHPGVSLGLLLDPCDCLRVICVENQWLPSDAGKGQDHRAHACDALGTARMAGRWLGAAVALGWREMPPVAPQTWRHGILGRRVSPRDRAQWKRWAIAEVKLRYGLALPGRPDEAEAILIATWAAGMMRLRPMATDGKNPEVDE